MHNNNLNNNAIAKPRAAAFGVAARHASADAAAAHAQRAPTMHRVQEQALKAAEVGLPLLGDEARARTRINKQLRTTHMHSPTHLDVRKMSSPEQLQGALTCMAGMRVCAYVRARGSKLNDTCFGFAVTGRMPRALPKRTISEVLAHCRPCAPRLASRLRRFLLFDFRVGAEQTCSSRRERESERPQALARGGRERPSRLECRSQPSFIVI